MVGEGLLDLGTRKGKAPGGYCETLHFRGRPFIFMNAVGVLDDVHDPAPRGGALPSTPSRPRASPWSGSATPALEAGELASMSMELLAAPYLGRDAGGFCATPGSCAWPGSSISRTS